MKHAWIGLLVLLLGVRCGAPQTVKSLQPSNAGSRDAPTVAPAIDRSVPRVDSCKRLAAILVIDRSRTLETELAAMKRAVVTGIKTLGPHDCVEVIAFGSQPTRVVPMATPSDAMEAAIVHVTSGMGGVAASAVEMGLRDALVQPAQKKHVVLLSDGTFSDGEILERLSQRFNEEGVTLSTVSVGESAFDYKLRSIATLSWFSTKAVDANVAVEKDLQGVLAGRLPLQ